MAANSIEQGIHGNITSVTDPTGVSYQMTYDARNRLIETEQNNRTLDIGYDSAQRVSQLTYPGGMEVEQRMTNAQ